MYTPPFNISAKAIHLIADISAQIERYAIHMEQTDGLRLRKANRIKTIHSSLAIEGNMLSEGEVKAIIEGQHIVAPLRQIQEVRNAIRTYQIFSELNAFQEKDLLRAHATMMEALIDDAGRYRRRGVGVFSEKGLEHMAPPAENVPYLMHDLLEWLEHSEDHLLIRSCVFHYEFEFIHPFSDGNGRMGRLWQSLILSRLHPLFEHLPVENMVYANQEAYYEAIARSSNAGQSGPFIDFMLGEIHKALIAHQEEEKLPNKLPNKLPDKIKEEHPFLDEHDWKIIVTLFKSPDTTSNALATKFGLSDRQIRTRISRLKEAGILHREGSNKKGHWVVRM